ncbi:MAG TPA: hypothetical protein VFW11_17385 [Cyclobacteriaceae bacterium]|nr:hypothetical protein [Cyclobacteriaceae bacterium]
MKTVRTVNGVSRIDDAAPGSQKLNDFLRTILIAHRDTLVKRVIDNLDRYIDYRFNLKPTKDQTDKLRNSLANLKGGGIVPAKHASLFMEINVKDHVYVGTKTFYEEIDQEIEWVLK